MKSKLLRAWLVAVLGAASCMQSDYGTLEVSPDGGAKACLQAGNCDDGNPCTTDSCSSDGFCVSTPLANGPAPAADQTPGDCQSLVCSDGEPSSIPDDTNTPTSTNPCVDASCAAGKVTMAPQPDGTACTLNGAAGSCMGGNCEVTCITAAMCVSKNPCQTGSCNGETGICVFTNVSDGTPTPGVTQIDGDCRDQECVGGTSTSVVDDSDLPAKMGDCQDPVCNNGTPGQTAHAENSPCSTYMTSMSGFCDGAGHCGQCAAANECPGTTNDCQQPACTSFACTTDFTGKGVATTSNPPQVTGDCLTIVCDGAGGTMSIADDSDLPATGTPCLTGTCDNGVSGTPTPNPGVVCGGTSTRPRCAPRAGVRLHAQLGLPDGAAQHLRRRQPRHPQGVRLHQDDLHREGRHLRHCLRRVLLDAELQRQQAGRHRDGRRLRRRRRDG